MSYCKYGGGGADNYDNCFSRFTTMKWGPRTVEGRSFAARNLCNNDIKTTSSWTGEEGRGIEILKEMCFMIGGVETKGKSIGGRSAVGRGEEEEGRGRRRAADERGGGQPAWEIGE